MKLHFLGTGAGGVLDCYNTCFAIENNDEYLLVDGGGGNQIIKQLNEELQKKGYLTVRGKVSAAYFNERFFGNKEDTGWHIVE